VFRSGGMWNRPRRAPEYRLAWGDQAVVRQGLERVILSHGDLITHDTKSVVARAWRGILE
jgi:hypothetical protein